MAVSLNSVVVFNLSGNHFHVPRSGIGVSLLKASHFASPSGIVGLRRSTTDKKWGLCLLVADGDKGSGNAERSDSDETESFPQTPEDVNESIFSSNLKKNASSVDVKPVPKRSPLTAREKLRAARVLSRYTESKASKRELGSKVLEALRESDRGKNKSGLPEAPTNLFDDSKRGMPKQGLTFDFPGGFDAFVIIFSFVTISSLMFATTYIVWKVGAIHFNEY